MSTEIINVVHISRMKNAYKIQNKMPVMANSCDQKAKDSNLLRAEKVIMVILCQFQKKGNM